MQIILILLFEVTETPDKTYETFLRTLGIKEQTMMTL